MPPIEFTKEEKSHIQILEQELDLDKFDDKGLPSDTHIVTMSTIALLNMTLSVLIRW